MSFFTHPVWLVGFRPFFTLACLSGAILPVLWVLLFSGVINAPTHRFSAVQWHAHEMFFGFGWAVIGGFLLTASKNWVQIRGYHGRALAFLAAAWLVERLTMWFGGNWPGWLFNFCNNLFLGSIVAMLLWTLIRHRSTDTYRDNLFFILALPAFLIAKNLMLQPEHFQIGTSMATGLFRMAFLLMLERTLTQFMKAAFQVEILRHPQLDRVIKLLGFAMIFESLMPMPAMGGVAVLLAILLSIRLCFWKPMLALQRLEIGVMYLGYIAIVIQLLLLLLQRIESPAWVGSVTIHVFTFGAMGLIIPAMLVRISKGHTGRKVNFDGGDKAVLWIMLLGFVSRVVAPQIHPAGYSRWIEISAFCWLACFAMLAWRYVPFLLQPRVDGKEH